MITNRVMNLLGKILIVIGCTSTNVFAAADSSWLPGECRANDGTKIFSFSFIKTITDVKDNSVDQVFPGIYQWTVAGGSYSGECYCPTPIAPGPAYFKAESSLPLYTQQGTKNFYKINDELAAAIRIEIKGQGQVDVPFEINNIGDSADKCNDHLSYSSGAVGSLDLMIIKPFIGIIPIQQTVLANLYSSLIPKIYGPIPISQVQINGHVTVNQSCEINAGNSIQVDFGDMYNGNFKGKGTKPEGVNSKTIQLGYKCNLVSKGMDVNMRFTGQSDSNYPNAFSTNNPDIGVIIQDGSGNPIQPNTGTIPMTVDYDTQTGSVDITTYPVSTTGNIPVVGQFTSRATVVVDFQ